MKKTALDSKIAGHRNELLVIGLLINSPPLSQAQICKKTGLNSSTISYIVGRLRDKNLITEKPGKSTKRGAKPILIQINQNSRFTIGIEINPSYIIAGLFNFNSKLIDDIKIPISNDRSPNSVIQLLEINTKGLISKNNIEKSQITGIGITISGSISKDGTVLLSSPLAWKNVPLKKLLNKNFDCPVQIFTTKVRLLAELSADPDLKSSNILYINVANGVGSNLIIDGKLIHGSTNRSGELGHITIDPDGPICGCGNKGCLEALISGPAIAARIKRDIYAKKQTKIAKNITSSTPEQVIAAWSKALKQNDQYAISIRDFIAKNLSRSTAIAANLYDPDTIILAGYVIEADIEYFIKSIKQNFQNQLFDSSSRTIKITPTKVKQHALIIGAAQAALQHILHP